MPVTPQRLEDWDIPRRDRYLDKISAVAKDLAKNYCLDSCAIVEEYVDFCRKNPDLDDLYDRARSLMTRKIKECAIALLRKKKISVDSVSTDKFDIWVFDASTSHEQQVESYEIVEKAMQILASKNVQIAGIVRAKLNGKKVTHAESRKLRNFRERHKSFLDTLAKMLLSLLVVTAFFEATCRQHAPGSSQAADQLRRPNASQQEGYNPRRPTLLLAHRW